MNLSRNQREGKYIAGGLHDHHDVAFSRVCKGRPPKVPTRYGSFKKEQDEETGSAKTQGKVGK